MVDEIRDVGIVRGTKECRDLHAKRCGRKRHHGGGRGMSLMRRGALFAGALFAGINILLCNYYQACENEKPSFLLETLRGLLPKAMARRARVRLVGVGLSRLSWNQHQTSLFTRESDEKWERVLERVDRVRGKLGFDTVHLGVVKPPPKRRP